MICQAHDDQVDRNTKTLRPSSSLSCHGRCLQDIKHGPSEVPEDPALEKDTCKSILQLWDKLDRKK